MLLEEALVLPLEVLFEHHAADLGVLVRLPNAGFRQSVGGVQMGVVVQLAWLVDAGVELLLVVIAAVAPVGLQQIPATIRERDSLLVLG